MFQERSIFWRTFLLLLHQDYCYDDMIILISCQSFYKAAWNCPDAICQDCTIEAHRATFEIALREVRGRGQREERVRGQREERGRGQREERGRGQREVPGRVQGR